jgi:hypothetical protein
MEVWVCFCIYTYTYTSRERERERERMSQYLHVCIHTHICDAYIVCQRAVDSLRKDAVNVCISYTYTHARKDCVNVYI